MGSRGWPLFDLNETPPEVDEGIDGSSGVQPQKVFPSLNSCTSDLLVSLVAPSSIVNNSAFSHASSSGFQPFVKIKDSSSLDRIDDKTMANNLDSDIILPKVIENSGRKDIKLLNSGIVDTQSVEKEEGEWSDGECTELHVSQTVEEKPFASDKKGLIEQEVAGVAANISPSRMSLKKNSRDSSPADPRKIQHNHSFNRTDSFPNDITVVTNQKLNGNAEHSPMDLQGDLEPVSKPKEVKGVESNHALKCANSLGKHKLREHKEAMLGKKRKRKRKTMFLNIEDVKQAGAVKSSTPKKQTVPIPSSTRTPKGTRNLRLSAEHNGEKQNELVNRDENQADLSFNEEHSSTEPVDHISESNTDINAGLLGKPRKVNSSNDLSVEGNIRHNLWKQPTDTRQFKETQIHSRKQASSSHGLIDAKLANKKNPPKRQLVTNNNQYQDTSVERLLREVTSEKFWHNPEESDLQCVPGRFESVEEYIRVFEPLSFEECRAQFYSTREELSETTSRDAHVMVRVKSVERRERGWYDENFNGLFSDVEDREIPCAVKDKFAEGAGKAAAVYGDPFELSAAKRAEKICLSAASKLGILDNLKKDPMPLAQFHLLEVVAAECDKADREEIKRLKWGISERLEKDRKELQEAKEAKETGFTTGWENFNWSEVEEWLDNDDEGIRNLSEKELEVLRAMDLKKQELARAAAEAAKVVETTTSTAGEVLEAMSTLST